MTERKPFKGIIPFSGGIDSTAALFHTLTSQAHEHFLVMKVCLYNSISANRMTKEKIAVEAILQELRMMGINNFEFKMLEYHYPSLGIPPLWDSEIVYFAAATCIRAYPEIEEIYEGVTADDYEGEGDDFEERLAKYAQIMYLVTDRSPENLKVVLPVAHLSKYEVMKLIPVHILALTWSCRYPEAKEAYSYTLHRCHRCPPCKMIDKVLDMHPYELNYE